MQDPEHAAPPELDETRSEPDRGPIVLVAQFFLIPLVVVILAIAIFLLFGAATREKRTPAESLREVRTGSLNRRWQAAFELSTALARTPALVEDQALFAETLRTFETVRDEPQVRRYLALALGRFRRPEAVSALIDAAKDPDEETRLYAVLALGAIRDPAAVAPLRALLRAEEPSLRKGAAFALGAIGASGGSAASGARDAIPDLRVTAEDTHFDVALQGALALAVLGDDAGLPALRKALDPEALAAAVPMRPEQQAEATINALRGIVLLHDRESLPRVELLARDHADLGVRDAALRARDALGH